MNSSELIWDIPEKDNNLTMSTNQSVMPQPHGIGETKEPLLELKTKDNVDPVGPFPPLET